MQTHVPAVLEINDLNFDEVVLGSDRPFLLDFSSAWCGPCKLLDPVLKALAVELDGQVHIGKLDIDVSPEVSRRLAIRGTPTLLVFSGGREVRRRIGATHKRAIVELCAIDG